MMTAQYFHEYMASLGFDTAQADAFEPTLETLCQLQLAHLTQYPFQSISTVLDEPIEIEPEIVFDKLVKQRRGGYCYELNGLFAQVLAYIGFAVQTFAGYVVPDNQPYKPKARTHTLLNVSLAGQDYLVDVGFGGLVPTAPLRLSLEALDTIQTTPHGRYRLSLLPEPAPTDNQSQQLPQKWVLSAEVKDAWQILYVFTRIPQDIAELTVGNWYVSTHPKSPFRARLMASRIEPNGIRHSLLNQRYRRHELGQPSQSQTVDNVDALLDLLTQVFYINTAAINTAPTRQRLQHFLTNSDDTNHSK